MVRAGHRCMVRAGHRADIDGHDQAKSAWDDQERWAPMLSESTLQGVVIYPLSAINRQSLSCRTRHAADLRFGRR